MWLLGWPLGLLLSAVSSVFGILGKLFLKLAHNQRERDEEAAARAGKSRQAVADGLAPAAAAAPSAGGGSRAWAGYFYAGLLSMLVLNPALGAVAYCFASQSLLAPMAGLTIGWNTLMGPLLLPHERLTTNDFVGASLIFAGCVLVGVSGTHDTPPLPVDQLAARFLTAPFLLYCAALLALLSALLPTANRALQLACTRRASDDNATGTPGRNRRPELSQASRVAVSVLAGVTSGQLFFLAATMRLLHDDAQAGVWRSPLTYVCVAGAIGTALAGLYLLNEALKVEDAVVVIYLYEASYILAGAVSGLCFFQDMARLSAWHYVVYALSLLLILLGIYVVAMRSNPQAEHEENLLPLLSAPPVDAAAADRIFQKAEYYAARRSSSPTRLLRALRAAEEHSMRRKSSPFILTSAA